MGRTRSTQIIEEKMTVIKPRKNGKAKPKNNNNDSGEISSDFETSPKSKKRPIAEVLGSDEEELAIRPKSKKSRVVSKPKTVKSKNKSKNNTNIIFEESSPSDDDFEVPRNRRVARESDEASGDEIEFTAREEVATKKKKASKKVVHEEAREEAMDLQHFAASDDEQEWEDVQWHEASAQIKSELDIAVEHEESEEEAPRGKKKREVRRASREERVRALELHRSHLLTLLAHGLHCSAQADDRTLQASVLSLLEAPSLAHESEQEFVQGLAHLADWFAASFTLTPTVTDAIDLTGESVAPARGKKKRGSDRAQALIDSCRTKRVDEQHAPIVFAALCRGLSLLTRVVQVLRPVSCKPSVGEGEETPKKKKKPEYVVEGSTCWVEVYSPVIKKWLPVDPREGEVDKMHYEHSPPYIVAFTHQRCTDVTPRYAARWSVALKHRPADPSWFTATLARLSAAAPAPPPELVQAELADTAALVECQAAEPPPTNQSGFRNHPRYCLAAHIGRYEALVPDTEPLGYFKGQPYYLRDKVQPVHTVEKWLEEGKQVQAGSEPVKKMKKKVWRDWNKDEESDYFGLWQTEPFEPIDAENGVVPKNKYGNVYLFTPEMLPHNTVLLDLPGLKRVCKMLNVDFAPAMIGWEKSGHPKPILQGLVVCAEHEDMLREAWAQDTERREKAREKKRVEQVLKRWAKLTRALLIKHRLTGEEHAPQSSSGLKNKTPKKQEKEHVHQFPEDKIRYIEAEDKWLKVCACGLEVVFEKL